MIRMITATGVCLSLLTIAVASPAATVTLSALGPDAQGLPDAVFMITGDGAQPAATHTANMDQRNKQFAPHVLPVRTGTAVSFPNSDNVRHQVYSFSPAKRFELPLYHGTQAEPVIFDKPGVVVLGCNIHDGMIGYILVDDSDWNAVADGNGRASVSLPEGNYRISFWHPLAQQQPAAQELNVQPQGAVVTVQFGALNPDPRNVRAQAIDNPFRRRPFDAQ